MKENEVVMIPFVAHESAMNRMERANRRLWIVILVMFIGMMIYFFIPSEIEEDSQSADNITDSEVNQTMK